MSRWYGLDFQVYELPADRRPITIEQVRTAEPLANSFELTDLTMFIGHISQDAVEGLSEHEAVDDDDEDVYALGVGYFRHAWVLFDQHSSACYALVCRGDRCDQLHPGEICEVHNTRLLDQPEGHCHKDSPYLHPRMARRGQPGGLSWVAVPVVEGTPDAVPVTLAEVYIQGDGDFSWAKEDDAAEAEDEGGQ